MAAAQQTKLQIEPMTENVKGIKMEVKKLVSVSDS